MYQINNEKFGQFLAEVRKEKQMTQKDLADKLFVSDKTVSKWERGNSMPNVTLLIPIADILGITVTELLQGEKLKENKTLNSDVVETLVVNSLDLSLRDTIHQRKKNWIFAFLISIGVVVIEAILLTVSGISIEQMGDSLYISLLMLLFASWLCIFAKELLPTYYDTNKVNFVSQGIFRIHMAGLSFNNANCGCGVMTDDVIRLREEIAEQKKALKGMKEMAQIYGFDISRPAKTAKEAIQWMYFGYLAAIKTQNGAAMSIGRVATFLDIYIQRDLDKGIITEEEAQEMIDHLTMKFRMVKFARIPSYNQLFSGDPVWATLDLAGIGVDGRSMVTKTDFRFLHTLENMGPSPEPNITVLYSSDLPENFKKYAADISIRTSSIQYENDDVMKPVWGDDYAICCCVSATKTGKEMQFFGARANLAKCLLYAINGGVDCKSKQQVGPSYKPIMSEYLDYDEVMEKYDVMMDWLVDLYVNTLNLIQYMHDKYYYEAAELALMDTELERTFATGIAGFSHAVDSLSAIKYAKVKAIRDEDGLVVDYEIEGDFPKYGNDDDRADDIAVWLLRTFLAKIKKHHTYRNSEPTTSILTITSNVVYGKATGTMPDGRKAGEPLAPGANPSYGAEQNGLLASLNSVAKLPYEWALDGISNTQTINPDALGHEEGERINNLVNVMDGYFDQGAHHLNVNVFGKEKLIDAMEHPEKEEYANFTIRVSGYAVKFIDLTREQQMDVISRTCHATM